MSEKQQTRREFIKKAAYVTPVIFTLSVAPSIASVGSENGAKGQIKSKSTGAVSESGKKYELEKQEDRYDLNKITI